MEEVRGGNKKGERKRIRGYWLPITSRGLSSMTGGYSRLFEGPSAAREHVGLERRGL